MAGESEASHQEAEETVEESRPGAEQPGEETARSELGLVHRQVVSVVSRGLAALVGGRGVPALAGRYSLCVAI